jgi:P-type Cu2+ transporter
VSAEARPNAVLPAPACRRVPAIEEAAICLHCASPLRFEERGDDDFCCVGCRFVYGLLANERLGRYYELRGPRGTPATTSRRTEVDRGWLLEIEATLEAARATKEAVAIPLDVQGIHCTACVWLLEELFRRSGAGALTIVVNPALGTVAIVAEGGFPLRAWVEHVERFGYLLGPSLKERAPRPSTLLLRMGVCIALAMNTMLFAIARYAGLAEGPIAALFARLELVLAFVAFAVGGSVFVASAWRALRARVLHLDLPIALGLVLALAGSTWSFFSGRSATYFDTLTVFTALMLVGRFLQERVIDKNRRRLLESDGVDGLLTRRIHAGAVRVVRCTEIMEGDELVVAPGDLIPVDAALIADHATISLDWIDGESAPRSIVARARVPAGAFNAGANAFVVRALTSFGASPLVRLLRATRPREADLSRATPWWRRLTRAYVLGVLAAAAIAFVFWSLVAGVPRALEITTAVLVVTCPCAFGIATPLAYELVQSGLRRAGLFVRSPGFLDRAIAIRRIVFDKTGTLTTGALARADVAALARLSKDETHALYNLVVRSAHPRSAAIRDALDRADAGATFDPRLDVAEEVGKGLELVRDLHVYRLDAGGYSVDGVLRARLEVDEQLRPDARREIDLLREAGLEVFILSGDDQGRVNDLADRLGVARSHAIGSAGPEQKADFVAKLDRGDLLMVGDGINDGLAVERATCSGTPAIDRPFMPARTDFYFTTPGLAPIGLALRASTQLARVVRRNLRVAILYNAATVGLAWAGLMSPLLAAVVMPVTSISIVLATTYSLSPSSRGGARLWRS